MAEIYIIHGRNSNPSKCWFPWLAEELRKEGHEVQVPPMPSPYFPDMRDWMIEIGVVVGEPSSDKYFVTHSLGGIALLKYFQEWAAEGQYGGAVMVAPFQDINLDFVAEKSQKLLDNFWFPIPGFIKRKLVKKSVNNSKKWTQDRIDWEKVRGSCEKYACLFSTNDPYVKRSQWALFEKGLGVGGFYFSNEEHLGSGKIEFPQVRDKVLELILG